MTYLCEIVEGRQTVRSVSMPTFAKEFDVIVCGLGTAGSLAALFSAENGLSVLGIEAFTCVGGTHTVGGVGGHYFGCPGGRYEQLDNEVACFAQRYTCTKPESRKFLAEQALLKQGTEILYEASVCGVYLEENIVIGLRVLTGGSIVDYGAKIVMDCTAEAYVASMAGCKTEIGRKTDSQMQPYSLVSMVFDGGIYGYTNVDFGRVNQSDPVALSKAILFARSYQMKERHAGTTRIAQMPLLGIREGRRIIPEETVRLEDLFADKQTKTPMFYSYADLDKHGWDIAFDGETLGDWAIGANLGAYNVTVAVPYKAILPKNYDGILVPCRALGVDRDISSCVRMNLDMKKMSEAAAEWASLAIKQDKKLREVPYPQLRERLTKSGCLKESDNRGYCIDGKKNWDGTPLVKQSVCWITDPTKLEDGLRTETPGQAIWSAKRMGAEVLPTLRQYLTTADENLKKHTAFAIASLGCCEANAILRDMVAQRDGLMLKDCRKNNNLRGCMAFYWLGRLHDREITEELIRMICDPKEVEKPVYNQTDIQTTRYKILAYNDIYFQFMSQAVMALIRIGNAHVDLRSQIEQAFTCAFSSDDYYQRITTKPKLSSEGNMAQTIKVVAFSAMQHWHDKE